MSPKVIWFCVLTFFSNCLQSQTKNYSNFPLVPGIQFHALSYPLKVLKANFSNPGIGMGTEFAWGKKHVLLQQFQLSWYNNKNAGNGFQIYTQTAWRPMIANPVFIELKAGVGYHYAYRPNNAYKFEEGVWASVNHRGKGMLTVPAGIAVGFQKVSPNSIVAPFASYQVLISTNYNNDIPFITSSLFHLGIRIHLPKSHQ